MIRNRRSEPGIGRADLQPPPLEDGTDCTPWCEGFIFRAESKVPHGGSQ